MLKEVGFIHSPNSILIIGEQQISLRRVEDWLQHQYNACSQAILASVLDVIDGRYSYVVVLY